MQPSAQELDIFSMTAPDRFVGHVLGSMSQIPVFRNGVIAVLNQVMSRASVAHKNAVEYAIAWGIP